MADRNKDGASRKDAFKEGELIFVGVGSSLSLEDTPALHLVGDLARLHKDVCAVNLEHSFWLLPDILRTHKSIYIVDSFVSDGPIGFVFSEMRSLGGAVLVERRFPLQYTLNQRR